MLQGQREISARGATALASQPSLWPPSVRDPSDWQLAMFIRQSMLEKLLFVEVLWMTDFCSVSFPPLVSLREKRVRSIFISTSLGASAHFDTALAQRTGRGGVSGPSKALNNLIASRRALWFHSAEVLVRRAPGCWSNRAFFAAICRGRRRTWIAARTRAARIYGVDHSARTLEQAVLMNEGIARSNRAGTGTLQSVAVN